MNDGSLSLGNNIGKCSGYFSTLRARTYSLSFISFAGNKLRNLKILDAKVS